MTSHASVKPLQPGDGAPPSFRRHRFERSFHVDLPVEEVWDWLNDPETFVKGQVWPWRVEFIGGGMEPGVLCNHHGPFMSFPGVIGEVRAPAYRDLEYLYGAYALSPRLVRPTRLQFWTRARRDGGTDVRLAIDCLVHRRFTGIWSRLQRFFWGSFHRWMTRGVARRRRKARRSALAALPFVNARLPSTARTRR